MALQFRMTTPAIDDLTLDLSHVPVAESEETEIRGTHLPAEWARQSGVQLTWPHEGTDWRPMLREVTDCYVRMALEIALREKLIIVTPEPEAVEKTLRERLPERARRNITLHQAPTNDTWARDHGFITLQTPTGHLLLDFQFNGWGRKFPAELDNAINRRLTEQGVLHGQYENHLDFVLEGGSIESDGRGTILTTSHCLLAPNRNEMGGKREEVRGKRNDFRDGEKTQEAGQSSYLLPPTSYLQDPPTSYLHYIEERLKHYLRAERVLWLDYGYLAGDDTDSHIDTLARLCPNDTIAYVQCRDTEDEHYEELRRMEEQLHTFRTLGDEPYHLIPLPMAQPAYDAEGQRLPATYANFLIINGAVLMPTYRDPERDELARRQLQLAFPRHEIVGIDCRVLIEQHGSLHCSAIQFPAGVIQ